METRLDWIDTVRGIATFFVILCHSIDNIYFTQNTDIVNSSIFLQLFIFTSFTLGRLGVPLFLFISGYLLLQRKYNNKKCFRFWKHNLLPLFILTEVWLIIYQLFSAWFWKIDFQWVTLFKTMIFLKPSDMIHMCYLPMILGMYISLPFVSVILKRFHWKIWIIPLAIVAAYSFGTPTINVILNAFGHTTVSNGIDLSFLGGIYGTYLIFGYMVYKESSVNLIKKYSLKKYFLLAAGVFFIITVLTQIYLTRIGHFYTTWYDFIPLALTAAFLFMSFKNCCLPSKLTCIFHHLAKYSFGIFLVHNPIMVMIAHYIPMYGLPIHGKIVVSLLLTFVISWGFVALVSKIPKVGKALFFIK